MPLRITVSGAPALLLLCSFALVAVVSGLPSGAPENACKDLKPGHGVEPSSGESPFVLRQDKSTASAGDTIKVTLDSGSKHVNFKGFLVQAVKKPVESGDKPEPIGKFAAGKGLKLLDSCSAVTHADRDAKKTATLVWEAPADLKADSPVSFRATVVQSFEEIFMNIKSTVG